MYYILELQQNLRDMPHLGQLYLDDEERALVLGVVLGGQLVGNPDKRGHYFTIWAARQTGKTWLMRRAIEEIQARYGDRFVVGTISMQDVVLKKDDPPEALADRKFNAPWLRGNKMVGIGKYRGRTSACSRAER